MISIDRNKFMKILTWVFCVLSILAAPVSFIVMCETGDTDCLGIAEMLKDSWIMWLFIPIPAILFFLTIITKKENRYYFLHIVVAIVSILIIGIFGSFFLIFRSYYSYNTDIVISVEEKTGVDFPDNIEVSNLYRGDCVETRIMIIDTDEREMFERMMRVNKLFISSQDEDFLALLPDDFEMLACGGVYEHILFYNVTEQKYNIYPTDENCEYFFILYNPYVPELVIVSKTNQ